MRITELFNIQSIALDSAAADQAQIIDELVELQATHGNLTDKAAYKAAIYAREAEASTYVDNGITVPHARAACVTRPSLAALRLKTPVQYNADDDGKTDLLFMIAAPENGSLHIDMLARLMQMLMNEDFVTKLRAAKRPKNFWIRLTPRRKPSSATRALLRKSCLPPTACWPLPPAPTALPPPTWPPKH